MGGSGRARSATSRELTVAAVAGLPDLPTADALISVVALDGPAGTGKSSVARGVAGRLRWRFVDTGATYRAATLAVLRAGVEHEDTGAVLAVVRGRCIQLLTDPLAPGVLLDGRDVSHAVRSTEVTAAVSVVSALPDVRALMIAVQRHAIGRSGAVVEGRDIATVVAPKAAVKVFLDARPEVRAQRRAREEPPAPAAEGRSADLGPSRELAVGRDLARRDAADSRTNRLEPAAGAVRLDTSDLGLDEVVDAVLALVPDWPGWR